MYPRILLGCLLTFAPAAALAAVPETPAVPDTPAVAVVQKYIAAHRAGQVNTAYGLLSHSFQAQLPQDRLEENAANMTRPSQFQSIPASLRPLVALIIDIHNTLHFQFRVVGVSPKNPHVVRVQAYRAGTPASAATILQVVTAPDPEAGGSLRLDMDATVRLTDPFHAPPGNSQDPQQAVSQSNLKQIALAILMYMQDHDEHLPDADRWIDEIMPYAKSEAIFHDPAAPAGEKWSYAYNRNLSGRTVAKLDNPMSTVLVFESVAGVKNASDTGGSVPKPGRHNRGTNYAFADGHVKRYTDGGADGSELSYQLSGK